MSSTPPPSTSTVSNGTKIVFVAGILAGTLDILQAFGFSGTRVLLSIAAGLIGPAARQGGATIYALGLILHFAIATIFAALYYLASKTLRFLSEYPIPCGLLYGLLIDLTMTLVVLPVSALHARGPFALSRLLLGIGVHMVTVGLPISLVVGRYNRNSQRGYVSNLLVEKQVSGAS